MPAHPEPANTLQSLFASAGTVLPDSVPTVAASISGAAEATTLGLPLFAFAIAFSPGPSNIVLLSTGGRVGVRGGLPLLTGMAIGYGLLWAIAASGLRFAVTLDPTLMRLVQGGALTLMALMAYKLVTSTTGKGNGEAPDAGREGPAAAERSALAGVVAGFAFQTVNPKAWITALAAAALFCTAGLDVAGHAAWFGAVAVIGVFVGCGAWLVIGAGYGDVLRRPALRRATNGLLAIVLIGSAVPLIAG